MKQDLNRLIIVLLFFMVSSVYAQQNEPKFEIKFFNVRGSIGLICDKGCSWKSLSIKTDDFLINQHGMVNKLNNEDINNSDFLLSLEKKGNKLYLKALKGTQWKELTFKLPKDKTKPVIINDSNMVSE